MSALREASKQLQALRATNAQLLAGAQLWHAIGTNAAQMAEVLRVSVGTLLALSDSSDFGLFCWRQAGERFVWRP